MRIARIEIMRKLLWDSGADLAISDGLVWPRASDRMNFHTIVWIGTACSLGVAQIEKHVTFAFGVGIMIVEPGFERRLRV